MHLNANFENPAYKYVQKKPTPQCKCREVKKIPNRRTSLAVLLFNAFQPINILVAMAFSTWQSEVSGYHDDSIAGVRINGPVVLVAYPGKARDITENVLRAA